MTGAIIFGLLLCAALIGCLLKGKWRLPYFTCCLFLLGAFAAGSGLRDGIRGNHWELRGKKGATSWYQEIALGVVLMGSAVYLARLDWSKKDRPISHSTQSPEVADQKRERGSDDAN